MPRKSSTVSHCSSCPFSWSWYSTILSSRRPERNVSNPQAPPPRPRSLAGRNSTKSTVPPLTCSSSSGRFCCCSCPSGSAELLVVSSAKTDSMQVCIWFPTTSPWRAQCVTPSSTPLASASSDEPCFPSWGAGGVLRGRSSLRVQHQKDGPCHRARESEKPRLAMSQGVQVCILLG